MIYLLSILPFGNSRFPIELRRSREVESMETTKAKTFMLKQNMFTPQNCLCGGLKYVSCSSLFGKNPVFTIFAVAISKNGYLSLEHEHNLPYIWKQIVEEYPSVQLMIPPIEIAPPNHMSFIVLCVLEGVFLYLLFQYSFYPTEV